MAQDYNGAPARINDLAKVFRRLGNTSTPQNLTKLKIAVTNQLVDQYGMKRQDIARRSITNRIVNAISRLERAG